VANGLVSYLFHNVELKEAIDEMFRCFHHHDSFQKSPDHRGWGRNCWHSLFQQAIRKDPVIYALVAAGRLDNEYRLVVHPYYVRMTEESECLSVRNPPPHGKPHNAVDRPSRQENK
jgi:hypothetical protein